jgi:tight adherence protein C
MGYAIFSFLIVFLLIGSGLVLLFYRESLGQRISAILPTRRGAAGAPAGDVSFLERIGMARSVESLGSFAGLIGKAGPGGGKDSPVRQRLILAGFRAENHLNYFYAVKVLLPLLLCAVTVAAGIYHWSAVLTFAMAIACGYIAPDFWLRHRIKRRQEDIRMGMPDLLDMLVVCLEAGLSMDQAALRSSEEMRGGYPVIGDEIALVMLEVRAGQSRLDAWKRFADRTDVDSVRMLVSILVQADQFGTGISRTLRAHADTMRTRRRMQAEEAAAKTTVKLVFPLVLFIFPSFFLVILGPAVIMISEVMKG